jgi:gas vesicle protein
MVGILSAQLTLPVAMGACAIASYAVGIVAALLLHDKTGVDLRTLDRERAVSAVQAAGHRTNTNSSVAANGGMT